MAESNLCSVAQTLLSLLRHGTSQTSTFIGQPSRRLPHSLPGICSSSVSPDTASSGSISQRCSLDHACMIVLYTHAVSAKNKAYFQKFHFRSIKSYSVIPLFRYSVFRILPPPIVDSGASVNVDRQSMHCQNIHLLGVNTTAFHNGIKNKNYVHLRTFDGSCMVHLGPLGTESLGTQMLP